MRLPSMTFLASALLCTVAFTAPTPVTLPEEVCQGLGLPVGFAASISVIHAGEAPDIPALTTRFTKLEATALAKNLLLMKITYAEKPDYVSANTILYLDLDDDTASGRKDEHHQGTDLMIVFAGKNVSMRAYSPIARRTRFGVAMHDNTAWVLLRTGIISQGEDSCRFSVHALCEAGKSSQSTPPIQVTLPIQTLKIPGGLTLATNASLIPLSHFLYYNNKIALLPLSDKGLTDKQVLSVARPIAPQRPVPNIELPAEGTVKKPSSEARGSVEINLLEEASIGRQPARVRLGVPFPQGTIFQTSQLCLRDHRGNIQPAQFAVMTQWPDQSLKWVLTQFDAELYPRANVNWRLEYGHAVKRPANDSSLRLNETDDAININTGAMEVTINKRQFSFAELVLPGQAASRLNLQALLLDEQERPFNTSSLPPKSVRVEEQGPERIVVRVEGQYGNSAGEALMSYIARMTFHRQSTIMDLAWTHLNSETKFEFTDITSLELQLTTSSQAQSLEIGGADLKGTEFSAKSKLTAARPNAVMTQWNDQQADASETLKEVVPALAKGETRLNGTVVAQFAQSNLTVALQDFWQRWPKAITLNDNRLTLGILPRLPDKSFGLDLPFWLIFSFCEGKYRSKWGMSFTEKISIDLSGQTSRAEMAANSNLPVLAVLPAAWYHQCQVFGDVSIPDGVQFAAWDEWFDKSVDNILALREQQREYGFYNFGDSFGERGRNWTNNEYDPPHGLFMQFVRTGNRKYARVGLQAARHQADVDIVHAYPDPYYLGANHQHSIGHTGQWSQVPTRATWTHRYDSHTSAENGHTWVEGMADAWCLAAEPRALEAAYALGEHITWGMSTTFTRLGTHERSAGWPLKAILCLYRYLGDPVYLEAAKRIVEVPLKEQKFDQGGAWPHPLPGDHSGSEPGAVGNAIFLIGVLLSGIKDYYEITGDERAAKSIIAGARWILLSYDADVCGWPYTARVDGKALFSPAGGSTAMAPQAVAYAGKLTGEKVFIDAAYNTIETMVTKSSGGSGKAFGSNTLMILNALGIIQQWYRDHEPDKTAMLLGPNLATLQLQKTRDARGLRLRAPNQKTFFAQLQKNEAPLTISRTLTGAMPKRDAEASIKVEDKNGKIVISEKCSTDKAFTLNSKLTGKAGDQFKIVIDDDQRGFWDISGNDLKVVGKLIAGSSMAQIGSCRYYFQVPAGVESFRLKITGVHAGQFSCTLMNPDGEVAQKFSGVHHGEAQLPHLRGVTRTQWLEVKMKPTKTTQIWTAILTAVGDFGLEFDGLPPYLASSKGLLFMPVE